ncbi:protein FAM161A isoform X1 [Gasterosteus aculeatus]
MQSKMQRWTSVRNKDSMSPYGGEGEQDSPPEEENGVGEEAGEEVKGGRSVRRSLSLEIYGLQREPHVHFSNREYYRRLEGLRSSHLRNMAELERMYIGQGEERPAEEEEGEEGEEGGGGGQSREDRLSVSSSSPASKLQRIYSQEELDLHDSSSGSDQSELGGAESLGEHGQDTPPRTPVQDRAFTRDFLLSPEDTPTRNQYRLQPNNAASAKPRGRSSRQTGSRVGSDLKATVPKPFQMMLREEERKRRKVRTRSQVELENALLRRELEELQECQKTFRASPAPAHIHLPLYEMMSRRRRFRFVRSGERGGDRAPFHFLERERRKREAKILAELERLGPQEERRAFRARPMPSSVYGTKPVAKNASRQFGGAPGARCQPDLDPDLSPDTRSPRPGKKQIELSIEMVKERKWCCTDL